MYYLITLQHSSRRWIDISSDDEDKGLKEQENDIRISDQCSTITPAVDDAKKNDRSSINEEDTMNGDTDTRRESIPSSICDDVPAKRKRKRKKKRNTDNELKTVEDEKVSEMDPIASTIIPSNTTEHYPCMWWNSENQTLPEEEIVHGIDSCYDVDMGSNAQYVPISLGDHIPQLDTVQGDSSSSRLELQYDTVQNSQGHLLQNNYFPSDMYAHNTENTHHISESNILNPPFHRPSFSSNETWRTESQYDMDYPPPPPYSPRMHMDTISLNCETTRPPPLEPQDLGSQCPQEVFPTCTTAPSDEDPVTASVLRQELLGVTSFLQSMEARLLEQVRGDNGTLKDSTSCCSIDCRQQEYDLHTTIQQKEEFQKQERDQWEHVLQQIKEETAATIQQKENKLEEERLQWETTFAQLQEDSQRILQEKMSEHDTNHYQSEVSLSQYTKEVHHLQEVVEETKREKETTLRKIQEEWDQAQLSFESEKKHWGNEREGLEFQYQEEYDTKMQDAEKIFKEMAEHQKMKITTLEKDVEELSIKKKECEKSIQLLTEKLEEKDLVMKDLESSRDLSIKDSIEHEKIQFRIKMEKQNNTNRRLQEQNEKLKSENRELILDNESRKDTNKDLENDIERRQQVIDRLLQKLKEKSIPSSISEKENEQNWKEIYIQLLEQNNEANNELDRIHEEIGLLKRTIKERQERLDEESKAKQNSIRMAEQYDEQNKFLTKEKSDLKKEIEQLKKNNDKLRFNCSVYESRLHPIKEHPKHMLKAMFDIGRSDNNARRQSQQKQNNPDGSAETTACPPTEQHTADEMPA